MAVSRAASGYHWSQQTSGPTCSRLVGTDMKPVSPGAK